MDRGKVYQELKQQLIGGELTPGLRIVEREISEKYNISRTPVREVLRLLVFDGLLVLTKNTGYEVRELTVKEIVDGFHSREAIEGMLVRLACQRGDKAFFTQIKILREQIESLQVKGNVSESISIGRQMHDIIAKAAKNDLLYEFYLKLQNISALTWNLTKNSVAIEEVSKEEHLKILKALEDKNAYQCEQYMREHLQSTCRSLIENYVILQGAS